MLGAEPGPDAVAAIVVEPHVCVPCGVGRCTGFGVYVVVWAGCIWSGDDGETVVIPVEPICGPLCPVGQPVIGWEDVAERDTVGRATAVGTGAAVATGSGTIGIVV